MIAEWIEQYFYHKQRGYAALLGGIAIIVVTLSLGFLLWQGTNDEIHPLIAISISTLLAVLGVGWGLYRLITERQVPVLFRVSFLLAMLCFSAGLLISGIFLKQEFVGITPDTYRTLSQIRSILSPLSWGFLLISQASRFGERQALTKRNLVLLVVTIITILAVGYLTIWR
jgi:hypothetical protein